MSESVLKPSYDIIKTIGGGSFSTVKLAVHRATRMKVAIKIISRSDIPAASSQKGTIKEARIMRMVDHPNIIRLFEIVETKTHVFLVLEYAPNGEVVDLIVAKGRMTEDGAKPLVRQIAKALDYLQTLNITHRDLKAENLYLDQNMDVKVGGVALLTADFGLSAIHENRLLSTICGSPAYAAPEIVQNKPYNGAEVDAWALGVNIYLLLYGDTPFSQHQTLSLTQAIVKCDYYMPDMFSAECKDLISKLLVIDPKKRKTMTEVLGHPWLNDGAMFLEPKLVRNASLRPKKEAEIDMEVLGRCKKLGMDPKSVVQAVLSESFNSLAATYYILAYQNAFNVPSEPELAKPRIEESVEETSNELANLLLNAQRNNGVDGASKSVSSKSTLVKPKSVANSAVKVIKPKLGDSKGVSLQPGGKSSTSSGKNFASTIKEREPAKVSQEIQAAISNRNTRKTTLRIDESLYLENENIGLPLPRTIKLAFNCTCLSPMETETMFRKLCDFLDNNKIDWKFDGFMCIGKFQDIEFEIEVCKIPKLNSRGIRVKRVDGDIREYKKFVARVEGEMFQ